MIKYKTSQDKNSLNVTTPKEIKILSHNFVEKYPKLKKLTITKNVEKIEAECFCGHKHLRKIYFVRDSQIEIIPKNCFKDCFNLEEIVLPESLVTISSKAFKNCLNLKSLIIPNSVKVISDDAFKNWKEDQTLVVFKKYSTLNSYQGHIHQENETEESNYQIIKDNPNRYFAVTCKCGHVGRDHYIPITFAIVASSKKDASEKASQLPRVKKNHRYRILSNKEIDYQTFLKLKAENEKDPYLHIKTKSQQRLIKAEIDKRTVEEDLIKNGKRIIKSERKYGKKHHKRKVEKWNRKHPDEKIREKP